MRLSQLFFCLSLQFLLTQALATPNLIFAIDLIRHGDRAPLNPIPTAPFNWPQGNGQLTAQGMQQEYQLGVMRHKEYVDNYHLLPQHYEAKTIYVRSTDIDRTLMSATSFLIGLYPPGTGPYLPDTKKPALPNAFQPIPIHTLPTQQDTMLYPPFDKTWSQLVDQYVLTRQDWQKKTNELQKNFPRWSNATGIKITKLSQLISLSDTLYIYQLHHIPLPPALTKNDVEQIIEAGHWANQVTFATKQIGDKMGHELVTEIITYLQKAKDHTTDLKYVLFSAHDTTIWSLMSALRAPLQTPPPYAANINIALFETRPNENEVVIRYNGKEVFIPACGKARCSLTQFMKIGK